ncbi:MAG: hypothetical protein FWG25_01195 [Promicromonosporaceae bacterium]|nr:hypothetical protein [Promicromonosporaceae bacterium]
MNVETVGAALVGRKVVEVGITNDGRGHARLDNGRRLTIIPNEGCVCCGGGDYRLTELNTIDNVITNVELVNDPSSDEGVGEGYKIFVYADGRHLFAALDGSDGDGYYGTGYTLYVEKSNDG